MCCYYHLVSTSIIYLKYSVRCLRTVLIMPIFIFSSPVAKDGVWKKVLSKPVVFLSIKGSEFVLSLATKLRLPILMRFQKKPYLMLLKRPERLQRRAMGKLKSRPLFRQGAVVVYICVKTHCTP